MSTKPEARSQVRIEASALAPYLLVGLAWFAFLMIAFQVRMIEPVFLWVFAHGLIVEEIGVAKGPWAPRAFLLAAYAAAGILAWVLVEMGGRDPRHAWRRAVLAWIAIQALFCLTSYFLVNTGVLHE